MGIQVHGPGSRLAVCTLSCCAHLEVFESPLGFIFSGFPRSHPPKDERFNEKILMSFQHSLSHMYDQMKLWRRMTVYTAPPETCAPKFDYWIYLAVCKDSSVYSFRADNLMVSGQITQSYAGETVTFIPHGLSVL